MTLSQFALLGLAEPVLAAVKAEGYTIPTPIQEKAIPLLLKGRDVIGLAQTGTGKTAAFVLPLLSRMADNPKPVGPKTARLVILAPTRELAAQIATSVRTYGAKMRLNVVMVIGGAKPGPQAKAMQRGADVLVATPGRLLDHMNARAITLTSTDTVVLDEADQMMDLGFMPAIRKIMSAASHRQQTLLFSATMPKPIRALANEFLREPAEVAVTPPAKTADKVEQSVYFIKTAAKQSLLCDLIHDPAVERSIVFTRTKHGADKVVRALADAGIDSEAIHGNKSQGQRVRALDNFKSGKVRVLVATDIAARGLDIDAVSHVFNFDMPNQPESYVHRIGRTARAGKSGQAVSFVANDERAYLRDIEKLTRVELKRLTPPEGTALDLSRPEEPGPHTMQSRGRGGGGGGRPQGQRSGGGRPQGQRSNAPRGEKSGSGKPAHRGGKPNPAGHRKGKVKAWSPV